MLSKDGLKVGAGSDRDYITRKGVLSLLLQIQANVS